ncbi:ribosomal protein L18e/L15P [Lineolata rhizophorae]|uniref:Ribosomal protein L18e/L15P n=1 Tax=Lineolata rhizophorae TaxID=578093 RepID=A0A6A6PFP9_9PEZI|nr:ribosomal protein L18e/L15P [Lineolata rhizophorae]
MPPRLNLLRCSGSLRSPATPVLPFLGPFLPKAQPLRRRLQPRLQLQEQRRAASILGSLSDVRGAYNKRIRRGRGPSSGKGKTSGRGHKGQKQHGKVPAGFNGGQTPLEVYKGKRGFKNNFATEMAPLNVDKLQSWVDQGRLDPTKPITMKELNASRCVHGVKDGVKLLARNAEQLKTPVNIVVSRASAAAIAAVEAAGGTVTTRFYSRTAIRRVFRGEVDPAISLLSPPPMISMFYPDESRRPKFPYRLPDPAGRKDLEYYRDPANRGYLSYMVGEGEGPSLFFKTPQQIAEERRIRMETKSMAVSDATVVKADNRLW